LNKKGTRKKKETKKGEGPGPHQPSSNIPTTPGRGGKGRTIRKRKGKEGKE